MVRTKNISNQTYRFMGNTIERHDNVSDPNWMLVYAKKPRLKRSWRDHVDNMMDKILETKKMKKGIRIQFVLLVMRVTKI